MSNDVNFSLVSGDNIHFIEDLYNQYLEDPNSVDPSWQSFFKENFDPDDRPTVPDFGVRSIFGGTVVAGAAATGHSFADYIEGPEVTSVSAPEKSTEFAGRVLALINAYRLHGHLVAKIDPLERDRGHQPPELNPKTYGIEPQDLQTPVEVPQLFGSKAVTLQKVLDLLKDRYCHHIGVEFLHIRNAEARAWLRQRIERDNYAPLNGKDDKTQILEGLIESDSFEEFLGRKYLGVKRFSISGGDALIPMLHFMLNEAGQLGTQEVIFGMAHRGRLSVLRNIMGKPASTMLSEFEHVPNPEEFLGRSDVKYHMGYSSDYTTKNNDKIHMSMAFNPSHLEFVDPVIIGRTRSKQLRRAKSLEKLASYEDSLMPILMHGDAAFAGQGIVSETLNMSQLQAYRVGGAVHIVINNQVGFTANPEEGRSTEYATDVAQMVGVPIFHVNGYDPEACVRVSKLAIQYRQKFKQDVVIDFVCYRRYGHNEGDEPRFTQPKMYALIDKLKVEHKDYAKHLVDSGVMTPEEVEALWNKHYEKYSDVFTAVQEKPEQPTISTGEGLWDKYKGGMIGRNDEVKTSVPRETLQEVGKIIATIPDSVTPHRTVKRLFGNRMDMAEGKEPLDWGFGEALAFATLVKEGHPVRLSGQDCVRATFGQRHAAVTDNKTGEKFWPTRQIPGAATFEVYNSLLSESAVLGFEHGYSLDTPDGLTLWEAQFGDFSNGAQVIIDQFVSASEDKWERLSNLVMLLPHAFEGQGPEHSSARLERYLQLCAEDNMYVCNLTTPANYFHALRRQIVSSYRKPLIIMSPKSLLRHRGATSSLDDLANGHFKKVIDDHRDLKNIRRVILCTGRLYYDLLAHAEEHNINDIALVRLEQLYPLPSEQIKEIIDNYGTNDVVWVQEEPRNMGAWTYLFERLVRLLGTNRMPRYVGRVESASPATGFKDAHLLEQERLIDEAFAK